MCASQSLKSRLILTEHSKFHLKKHLCTKFKFAEYFFYNREIINRQKVYKVYDSHILLLLLKKARMTKVKLSEFSLLGLHNSGSYGNTYLIKKKNFYFLKTIRSKLINMRTNIDLMTTNYIGLLRERDALLNCGGLWTPKVIQTFEFPHLPISVAIEAIVGWSLKHCIHIIHTGTCSRCLIYSKRNQMTLKAQSALLTGSAEFIEPMQSEIIPIIRFWMAELLVAVRFIHQQGVLHRDLRPDNVIVTDNGHLKLNDFDLNTELYNVQSNTSDSTISYACINCSTELPESIVSPDPFDTRKRSYINRHAYPYRNFGCVAYSAPELHDSTTIAEYTSKCDYWSVGCIFFYMLFMINPFDVCYGPVEEAKLMSAEKSLLNPAIVDRRCWNIPSAKQLLLDVLCVEPVRRLDDNLSESSWIPETLEFFESLDFKTVRNLNPPFKPIISDPESCFDLLPMDSNDIIHDMMEDFGNLSLISYTTSSKTLKRKFERCSTGNLYPQTTFSAQV